MSADLIPHLTLYYDGLCPFCVRSMGQLKNWDTAARLAFVDIAAPGFDPAPLGADMAALNREVHALTRDGKVLAGIDTAGWCGRCGCDCCGPCWRPATAGSHGTATRSRSGSATGCRWPATVRPAASAIHS
jgi:hypothetical protein